MAGPHKILRILSLLVTLCGAASVASSQPTVRLPNSLYESIQKAVGCHRIPGLTVSVVFNGQDVMSTGFGLADVDKNATVNDNTKFLLGSVTKTFTATLLGMLMTKNRYPNGWDTLVADIMGPDFQLIDSREKLATVRDVLSHRMGLVSYTLALMLGLDDKYSDREYCSRFQYINSSGFNSFRNQFEYNNQMFVLAGCMVEAVTNRRFETIMREHIFDPLGMNDTQFVTSDNLRQMKDLAEMYYIDETDQKLYLLSSDTLRCALTLGPAGGIITTAADMKKWMLFLLNQGKDGQGRQLIPEDVLEQMFVAQIPMPKSKIPINKDYFQSLDSSDSYGIGFILGYYRGYPKIMHTGRILAFETRMTILRGAKLGIFSACNGPAYLTSEIHQVVHYMITDALLDVKSWLNDTTACTFPKPWSLKIPGPKPSKVEMPTEVYMESSRKTAKPREWLKSIESNDAVPDGLNGNKYFKNWLKAHHDVYTGLYGHLLFGNFSVTYNESDGNLHFSFGLLGSGTLAYDANVSWTMELEGPMAYLKVSQGPYLNNALPIEFEDPDKNGRFRSLIVFPFEPSKPPIFRRDLKWAKPSRSPFSMFAVSETQLLLIIVACIAQLMITVL